MEIIFKSYGSAGCLTSGVIFVKTACPSGFHIYLFITDTNLLFYTDDHLPFANVQPEVVLNTNSEFSDGTCHLRFDSERHVLYSLFLRVGMLFSLRFAYEYHWL